MTYSLTPEIASLGKNQLAKKTGWLTVYHADETTREYTGASYEFIMKDTGLPAYSYIDAPTQPDAGYGIIRSLDNRRWEYIPDHRGETVFNTLTRETLTVSELGDYPIQTTPQEPTSEFDVWNGEKWVTDHAAMNAAAVAEADVRKTALITSASAIIAPLADAAAGGYIDEANKSQLAAWQKYRYQLTKVDITAAEIVWP